MDLSPGRSLSKKKLILVASLLLAGLALFLFLYSDNPAVWTVRNTAYYYGLRGVWSLVEQPEPGEKGSLAGRVTDSQGQPIEGAWVLVSRWDGTTYSSRSDAEGDYTIPDIPEGRYRPVAGAPGYENVQEGGWLGKVAIEEGDVTELDLTLPQASRQPVAPGEAFWLSEPADLSCTHPFESSATRRQVHFQSAGQPNQAMFYYTPITTTASSALPLLLIIYPGPADSWECASLPVAMAGYAVLTAGPAYSFDLEADLDELERLVMFAREGAFPGADSNRIGLLGGSYSSLHVQRLLQRGLPGIRAAVLLGPPTDLFDMRRRLEDGSYVPPFGLDKAFVALGLPSQEPLRYWQYSGAYHVRKDFPPLAILHSRSDDVVPYQQSELLANNLALVGAEYELHFFEAGGHYLLAEKADADTEAIYGVTLDFLGRHLRR